MGVVVTRDVAASEVWVGVQARYLRAADVPHELIEEKTCALTPTIWSGCPACHGTPSAGPTGTLQRR